MDPDALTQRCRRLGHEVTFHYCRCQDGNTVCPSIRNCWWERFDIDAYLRRTLPPERFEALVNPEPPVPKLVDLIRRAQEARDRQRQG